LLNKLKQTEADNYGKLTNYKAGSGVPYKRNIPQCNMCNITYLQTPLEIRLYLCEINAKSNNTYHTDITP